MPCTLSTQTRAPFAQPSAPMSVIWTSLPFDQVCSVGDCLLVNNDIDDYMAFRAVCKDWRSATTNDPDTRFLPTKWALLDQRDGLVTLVNVDTGRFLCKRIPLLHDFFFIGATSGGLILLAESAEPHWACVLNPFTGSVAHFMARIPCKGVRAVAMTTKPQLIIFIFTENYEIMWADQSMVSFKCFKMAYPNMPTCITSFEGNLYTTDRYGSIYSSIIPADAVTTAAREPRRHSAVDITMDAISPILDAADTGDRALMSGRYYLVESAGDLLLVTEPLGFVMDQPLVRRVNMETKVIEPVSSIGSRALFVSHVRCLSINADNFPSIQGGCVYFVSPIDRAIVRVADNFFVEFTGGCSPLEGFFRPFALSQVITYYCRFVYNTELYEMMMIDEWDSDISYDDSESNDSSSSEHNDEELSSSELNDKELSSSKHDDEASCSEPTDD